MRYEPAELVVPVYAVPVAALLRATLASTRTAPLGSETTPVTVEVVCAKAEDPATKAKPIAAIPNSTTAKLKNLFIDLPFVTLLPVQFERRNHTLVPSMLCMAQKSVCRLVDSLQSGLQISARHLIHQFLRQPPFSSTIR